MPKKRLHSGFTLIELMIIIAVMVILAAVAIPSYKNYTVRNKVKDALDLSSGSKQAVTEYRLSNSNWPTDNAAAGLAAANMITGNHVASVTVSNNSIAIAFNSVDPTLAGKTVTLTGSENGGSILWGCTSTLEPRYVPSNCK
ncbi:pilin [Candidatus Magnetaquicoccus inordinatus]|uniref:pilin n=1 Tax=Candidatus Magnetaquicoccus inordinatus TaxID=2496818 RepID=UPI00102C4DB7|nr:pilin [Candidatus Magnetaquicoccus inordinatus]